MRIGGFTPLSTIDYKNHLSAVIYTQGCNFRCPYCHNWSLVEGKNRPVPQREIISLLEERRNFLDGVVITGGEPTIHPDLPILCHDIKLAGYDIKLDTNGSNPDMVRLLIEKNYVDYIALDIKAPWRKYKEIAGTAKFTAAVIKTLKLLTQTNIPFELRTTVHSKLLSINDIREIIEKIIILLPAKPTFYLQIARETDRFGEKNQYTAADLKKLKEEFKNLDIKIR